MVVVRPFGVLLGTGGWEAVGVEKVGNLKEQHTKTTVEFNTE